MIATPWTLRQFTYREEKAANICRHIAGKDIPGKLKRYFSKSADDHVDMAESVAFFIGIGYHDNAN